MSATHGPARDRIQDGMPGGAIHNVGLSGEDYARRALAVEAVVLGLVSIGVDVTCLGIHFGRRGDR